MTTTAPKKPRKPSTPRLKPHEWAEAEALWESGAVTLEELSKKFSKDRSVFLRYFKSHGIVKGSKAEERKEAIKEAVTSSVMDDATILAARIKETKEEHYKMSTALAKLTWAEVLNAKKELKPFSLIKDNLKALEIAVNVLMKTRAERFAILGLDKSDFVDEGGLPELVISELTAEQIEEMRNRDENDLDLGISTFVDENTNSDRKDDDEGE